MKERPIAFTDGLVDLVVSGRKTQTRRCVGKRFTGDRWRVDVFDEDKGTAEMVHPEHGRHRLKCPYGGKGTGLYLRQGWKTPEAWDDTSPSDYVESWEDEPHRAPIVTTSNGLMRGEWPPFKYGDPWSTPGRVRAPMHMPRALAIHRATVSSLRLELVNAITEDDARAEGVDPLEHIGPDQRAPVAFPPEVSQATHPHMIAFAALWDRINFGRGLGCAARPWVWVVGLENPRSR